MTDAVTPPNPADGSQASYKGGPPVTKSEPDPTLLTIDSIRREIAMLENLGKERIDAAENLNKERFHSIDQLMERSEEQRREQKADTKEAVDAALNSQEQATHKMEKSISDQINSLRNNFEVSIRSVQSNVADLKDRMTILEAIKQGVAAQKQETRQATAGQIAAIGIGITVIMAILAVVSFAAGSM